MAQPQQPIRPFKGENIPQTLKDQARWAPWKAVWSEKRGKYDKIPCNAQGYGISTAKPERWGSFESAVKAYEQNPDKFAGVGYVMTGPHGVVGTDLDRCVEGNTIAPWALEIVEQVASYTELSPSGNGLRIFTTGEVAADWTNHEVGIEVYGGHEPRFLTVTGNRLKMSGAVVVAPGAGVMEALGARYARDRSTTSNVISLTLPELLDDLLVPDLQDLDIGYAARDFLSDGTHKGDRSGVLFATAVSLYCAGLGDDEVFSVLATNPHAMEVALDHRRQDPDRALMYLWVEQCQKAKPRAASRVAGLEDFEDVSESNAPLALADTAQAATKSVAPKAMRFAFTPGEQFFDPSIAPTRWTIKKLLPETGLGMVFGPSMSGKTFFVLDLAMAVALGREWRGHKVNPGQVAYICAEGGTGFRKRGLAYLNYHGLERGGLPMHLLADAPNLLERGDVKDLITSLKAIEGLKLVVVDTLAQTTPGANENASEDMGRAMAHCNKIVAATGALVLLVGHTGKDEGRGHRGWSGMPAAFDVSIQLERSGEYRAATIVKMKDGEGEGAEYPFHLNSVTLGVDDDGDAITSCVALPGNKDGVEVPKDGLTDNQRLVLQVAGDLLDFGGLVDPKAVREAAKDKLPKPAKGKNDNRPRDIKRAYDALVSMQRIADDTGNVRILAG